MAKTTFVLTVNRKQRQSFIFRLFILFICNAIMFLFVIMPCEKHYINISIIIFEFQANGFSARKISVRTHLKKSVSTFGGLIKVCLNCSSSCKITIIHILLNYFGFITYPSILNSNRFHLPAGIIHLMIIYSIFDYEGRSKITQIKLSLIFEVMISMSLNSFRFG